MKKHRETVKKIPTSFFSHYKEGPSVGHNIDNNDIPLSIHAYKLI